MSLQEQEVFRDGDVLVTTARIRLHGGKTYATANVTSVSTKVREHPEPPSPSKQGPLVVMGIGVVLGLVGLNSLGDNFLGGAFWLLVGGAVVYGGLLWLKSIRKPEREKPDYVLMIGSASGEAEGMESKDRDLIARVANAINDAIVARG